MSPSPLVSVIIPCYNYARFLGEALDSILSQSYPNWECIVVNDGSTDNTEEVALRYAKADARFIYLYQKNSGQWASRNLALERSGGKYIQYLDADDMLEPEKLKMQVPILEESPEIDVVYGDILKFEHLEKEEREFVLFHQPEEFPKTGRGEDMINALLVDNFFLPGCVLMRRSVFTKLEAPFKKAYGLEDWDIWFRIASANCEFYHDPRPGTRLLTRHHGNNVSLNSKKLLADRLNVRKVIIKDFVSSFKKNKLVFSPSFVKHIVNEHRRLLYQEKAAYHLNYGNLLKGVVAVSRHAFYSRKPFFAIYDGAHYLKERVKRNRKKR